MLPGSVSLPAGLSALETSQAPAYPVRGHQLGYRAKNNTFDGWTPQQFEQYIRDLAIFGTNTIELIPPRSDDAPSSPLFPIPAPEMMTFLSTTLERYGLDCSIWYPALDKDYADPATIDHAVAEWGALFRTLPRINAVFVPGGDPGHTRPRYLFNLLERVATELHKTHPDAQMWVSPQSFSAEWLDEFYDLLRQQPRWLTGVVYGPEMRDSPEQFRQRVPAGYPIRFYPDITHTLAAQYPVPDWDPSFGMTEGREPINPRPVDEGILFHRYAPLTNGFVAYSEGSNDDVNKVLWSGWGWNPNIPAQQILTEYARFFISPKIASQVTTGTLALERNWRGPLATNPEIPRTLALFQQVEHAPTVDPGRNWRLQQLLYRAYYDAFLQQRAVSESEAQQNALAAMQAAAQAANQATASESLGAARAALGQRAACQSSGLCTRATALAGDLFASIRMQLSVSRFGALATDRGANLDRIDVSLYDHAWLLSRIAAAEAEGSPAARLRIIESTIATLSPPPSTLTDDLGAFGHHPHLETRDNFSSDPSGLTGVYNSVTTSSPNPPVPRFARAFAGTLYDQPLQLRYAGLHSGSAYTVRVVYPRDGSTFEIRVNGRLISSPCATSCTTATFLVPADAISSGSLLLSWALRPGLGGSGHTLAVSRVQLEPNDQAGSPQEAH